MDLKHKIIQLVDDLDEYSDDIMDSVIVHLERAEYFLEQGDVLYDDQYYNDVVYRTNQAYEGILKFAYIVFTGDYNEDGSCSLSTYQIENHFEKTQVFNYRVKIAFTLYRKLWRNPSAHDSELFFNRDEAFLAIIYVSTFIYILLGKCSEHISYKVSKFLADLDEHEEVIDQEVIIKKLMTFHKLPIDKLIKEDSIPQLIGSIKGYLERINSGIEVVTHYKGDDVIGYQPDIVLNYGDETLIFIEVKRDYTEKKQEYGHKQLKDSLFRSDVKKGIIYFYTDEIDAEYEEDRKRIRDREIITLKPKSE